jgi:hypothetical protein
MRARAAQQRSKGGQRGGDVDLHCQFEPAVEGLIVWRTCDGMVDVLVRQSDRLTRAQIRESNGIVN